MRQQFRSTPAAAVTAAHVQAEVERYTKDLRIGVGHIVGEKDFDDALSLAFEFLLKAIRDGKDLNGAYVNAIGQNAAKTLGLQQRRASRASVFSIDGTSERAKAARRTAAEEARDPPPLPRTLTKRQKETQRRHFILAQFAEAARKNRWDGKTTGPITIPPWLDRETNALFGPSPAQFVLECQRWKESIHSGGSWDFDEPTARKWRGQPFSENTRPPRPRSKKAEKKHTFDRLREEAWKDTEAYYAEYRRELAEGDGARNAIEELRRMQREIRKRRPNPSNCERWAAELMPLKGYLRGPELSRLWNALAIDHRVTLANGMRIVDALDVIVESMKLRFLSNSELNAVTTMGPAGTPQLDAVVSYLADGGWTFATFELIQSTHRAIPELRGVTEDDWRHGISHHRRRLSGPYDSLIEEERTTE